MDQLLPTQKIQLLLLCLKFMTGAFENMSMEWQSDFNNFEVVPILLKDEFFCYPEP
jgi:hypothetical protein